MNKLNKNSCSKNNNNNKKNRQKKNEFYRYTAIYVRCFHASFRLNISVSDTPAFTITIARFYFRLGYST